MASLHDEPEPHALWQAEKFRLTLFLSPSAESSGGLSWESLVGSSPAIINDQPPLGIRQESGPYEAGVLTLTFQPQRIDCLLSAQESQSALFDVIGLLEEHLDSFTQIALRILSSSPPVLRIAFGAILLHPVENGPEGYRLLASFLPSVSLDADNSSDFLYRINRHHRSEVVDGLAINRLCTWSVIAVVRAQIQIPAVHGAAAAVTKGPFAGRLELDVNTVPEWKGDLPEDRLADLFGELVHQGLEIAKNGDRQ